LYCPENKQRFLPLQMVAAANLCAGVFWGDQCPNINGMTRRRTSRRRRRRRSCMVCFLSKQNTCWKRKQPKKKIEKKKSSRFFKIKGPPCKQTSLTTTQVNPKIAVSYTLNFFSDLQFYGRCKNYSAK
jgi:hypothetical protein